MHSKLLATMSYVGLAAAVTCGAADAPSAPQPHYVSSAELDRQVVTTVKGVAANQIPTDAGSTVLIVRRDSPGEVELHWRMNDIFVVKSGHATITLGGRIEHNHEIAPSEWRGGEIIGGTTRELSPGDLLLIPAGIPHQLTVPTGSSFTYFAIKTLAQPLPAQPRSVLNH
jgi:mannose-6-phosphate isomerase-like protein (cupin superfamily)